MSDNLVMLPIKLFALLYAIVIHEWAHGYAAYKMGDNTAYYMGRLTLNPLKHIDPIGTVILPAVMLLTGSPVLFGWAKPVPINPHNFDDIKKSTMYVSLAGPAANLVSAFAFAGLFHLIIPYMNEFSFATPILYFLIFGAIINIVLFAFNLIPIPPLDGSHVVSMFLSPKQAYQYNKIAPYGFFIIMGMVIIGITDIYLRLIMHLFVILVRLPL